MERRINFYIGILLFSLFCLNSSCNKQDDFLAAKPDQSLAVPSTLEDFQSLLNNENIFNINDPGMGTISADEYYSEDWPFLTNVPDQQNTYIWAKDIFPVANKGSNDWDFPYKIVYYSNIILDGLGKNSGLSSNQDEFNRIKGSALFYRANAFYNLVQTFSLPFDSATADSDLGIPLRLSSDLNEKSKRATVKECYDQILDDLQKALDLLPTLPSIKTQPSKAAVNALFARIYLSTRNYTKALNFSNDALLMNGNLVDYNSLTVRSFSISNVNAFLSEEIFHSCMLNYDITLRNSAIVDTILYASYDNNDLRRTLFFSTVFGKIRFRGTYDYKGNKFSGLSTDEMYLIRAECYARMGNINSAMSDLNTLLRTRWKKVNGVSTYVDQTAIDANDALNKILKERKKQLLFRGLRWTDIKRLNKENANITLTRKVNGQVYSLPPNDPKYALPIPPNEISLSGLSQNAR